MSRGVVGAPRNLWETGGTTPRPGRGVDAPNCHLPLFTRPTAPSPSQGIQPLRAAGRAKSWAPRTHPQSRPGWVPDALETLALSLQVAESHPCPHHLASHRRIRRSWREGGVWKEQHIGGWGAFALSCALTTGSYSLPWSACSLGRTLRRPASPNEIPRISSKYAADVGMNSLLLLPADPTANQLWMGLDSLER